jgi:hypothetical protein
MAHPYLTHTGEPFVLRVVKRDGVLCRWCGRVIRVREVYSFFPGQVPPYLCECRDCLYSAPLTEFNKWRKDHHEHNVEPDGSTGAPTLFG